MPEFFFGYSMKFLKYLLLAMFPAILFCSCEDMEVVENLARRYQLHIITRWRSRTRRIVQLTELLEFL